MLLALVMARLGLRPSPYGRAQLRLAPSTMLVGGDGGGGRRLRPVHWTRGSHCSFVVSYVFVLWAMATNRFFSGVMRIRANGGTPW